MGLQDRYSLGGTEVSELPVRDTKLTRLPGSTTAGKDGTLAAAPGWPEGARLALELPALPLGWLGWERRPGWPSGPARRAAGGPGCCRGPCTGAAATQNRSVGDDAEYRVAVGHRADLGQSRVAADPK